MVVAGLPSTGLSSVKRARGQYGSGPLSWKSARAITVVDEASLESHVRETEMSPLRLKIGKAVLER